MHKKEISEVVVTPIIEFVVIIEELVFIRLIAIDHELVAEQLLIVIIVIENLIIAVGEVDHLLSVEHFSIVGFFLFLNPAEISIFLFIKLFVITVFGHATTPLYARATVWYLPT